LPKAKTLGFKLALPWGDSERYDFVVWMEEGGPIFRMQVKGTGRLYRRGYEVQAAHIQPVDVWYLLPIKAVGRAKSLHFYPDIKSRKPMWEEYREAWAVLEERSGGSR
jgi:hypothetical protein